ncbi:unnamed protein product [Leuciscus chuanchicus]
MTTQQHLSVQLAGASAHKSPSPPGQHTRGRGLRPLQRATECSTEEEENERALPLSLTPLHLQDPCLSRSERRISACAENKSFVIELFPRASSYHRHTQHLPPALS